VRNRFWVDRQRGSHRQAIDFIVNTEKRAKGVRALRRQKFDVRVIDSTRTPAPR